MISQTFSRTTLVDQSTCQRDASKVATKEFTASHPVDIIERTLTKSELSTMLLGNVDPSTVESTDIAAYVPSAGGHGAAAAPGSQGEKPSIYACINIYDFEAIASGVISEQAWAYYSSGADDEITLRVPSICSGTLRSASATHPAARPRLLPAGEPHAPSTACG